MRKDRKHHGDQHGEPQQKRNSQRPEYGYVYLIKNPSSNELTVCASDDQIERGAHVIAPSRYGLDYGMVVGSAMDMGQYEPGSTEFQGACLHGEPLEEREGEGELLAVGEPGEELGEADPPYLASGIVYEKEEREPCSGCTGCNPAKHQYRNEKPVKLTGEIDWIDRIATQEDYVRFLELSAMEDEALVLCREKVLAHGLDMKLVSAHYLFGEPKVIFFFTAANRVDFRELVKDLVSIFRIRIELRQIGVRDESRLLGGLAVCGRDFCCHGITDKMNPVSIKMAKEQNLSLNSTKISGPCGRLLCCLSYEYDFYSEERQKLPQEGYRFRIDRESMKVIEVNVLTRKLILAGSEGNILSIPFSALEHDDGRNHWEVNQEYLNKIRSN